MTTAQQIVDSVEVHIRDTTNTEVTEPQLLRFINDAAQDVATQGWWVPLEHAGITFASSVAVPALFSFIREIKSGTGFINVVPRQYWDVRIDAGVPTIFFDDRLTGVSGALKLIGWKKPKADYVLGDTIDPGLEPFLRERASHYALTFMSAGLSELDRLRQQTAETKYRNSETIFQRHIEERKVLPAPRLVPGR